MKVIFVQTYPLYHDGADLAAWFKVENRDKWMPMICQELGYEAELWGVGKLTETFIISLQGNKKLTIRVFKADYFTGKSKKHYSSALVEYASIAKATIYMLKGLDGGIGQKLMKAYLLPNNVPFAFVIGGKYLDQNVFKAEAVLYETEEQRLGLERYIAKRNRWPFLKKRNPLLFRLPKSMDTEVFQPATNQQKTYDIVAMGRLIPYYKNYDALFRLADTFRIGFIGGGPTLEEMRKNHPKIDWLGAIPHSKIPKVLTKGKLFFHTSLRDYFPRVIPEAAACGLPVLAFQEVIKADVLPDKIGLRLSKTGFEDEIKGFLQNHELIAEKAINARNYAVEQWGIDSSMAVMKSLFKKLEIPQ